jgi:hypothetical protein
MLDGDWESIHKIIDDSQVEKIVKWLHKTYGLQVYRIKETQGDILDTEGKGICMAYGDGFHVCELYTRTKEYSDYDGVSKETTYYYVSPFNLRDRYSREYRNDTRASKGLTNLMNIIKKIMPIESSVNNKVTHGFCELKETIEKTVQGTDYKSRYELEDNMVHALLQKVLGGSKVVEYTLDVELASSVLIKWDSADATALERRITSSQLLEKPLTALGVNKDGTYMIGTIQKDMFSRVNEMYTILTPFKRISKYSLEEYPMVQAMVTMFSVVNEDKQKCIEFIPMGGGYNADLNVISIPIYNGYNSGESEQLRLGGMGWLLMPAD